MSLTEKQQLAAKALLRSRPTVVPGTRVVVDPDQREKWYEKVTAKMTELGLKTPAEIDEFCDEAGVPD